jgi:hypothetical protein
MSMEWFFDALRAFASLARRRGRAIGVLSAAGLLGTVAIVAVREWRAARQALCAGRDDEGTSRVALRTYPLEAQPSPLVADRFAGRVGSQVTPLQPVEGAVTLEPAEGATAALSGPTWIGVGQRFGGLSAKSPGRPWAEALAASPLAEVPPLPQPASDGSSSILVSPSDGDGGPRPRPWDISPPGPSLESPPTESPWVESSPADAEEAHPAPTPTEADAAGSQWPGSVETATEVLQDVAPPPPGSETQGPGAGPEGAVQGPGGMMADDPYASELRRLLRPITQVDTTVSGAPGQFHPDVPDKDERPRLPRAAELFAQDAPQVHGAGRTRPWPELLALWEAPGLAHHPLYFEEVNLERYGYSFGLAQPVVSAAHFFGRIPALPYLATVDPPHRCVYTLGHYRPGSCAPLAWNLVPFDPLAAAVQGGVVTGLVYLIP